MKSKNLFPISVEKLAAYLDGALPKEEMANISALVENNPSLQALIDTSDFIENEQIETEGDDIDYNVEEIEIPSLDNVFSDEVDADSRIFDDNINDFLSLDNVEYPDNVGGVDENHDSMLLGTNNIVDSTKTYGYEPNYELEKFDPNIYQGYSNTCAIRSQEIVLRDYGIMIEQDDLVQYATEHGWFNPDPLNGGTDKNSVGNIIDACGIQTTRTENATIFDIVAELRAGHRVIVSVDADELWIKKEPNVFKKLFGVATNKINDKIQNFLGVEGANHALIVAGVNVNPNNLDDIQVILTDPGTGEVCIQYKVYDFYDAWNDGHRMMISTNTPAPYQYNYETHQMEPSNYETDYIPSMIEMPDGLSNSFARLTSSFYNLCLNDPAYSSETPPYDFANIVYKYPESDQTILYNDKSHVKASQDLEIDMLRAERSNSEEIGFVYNEEYELVGDSHYQHLGSEDGCETEDTDSDLDGLDSLNNDDLIDLDTGNNE